MLKGQQTQQICLAYIARRQSVTWAKYPPLLEREKSNAPFSPQFSCRKAPTQISAVN